jgi:hypothetical protein
LPGFSDSVANAKAVADEVVKESHSDPSNPARTCFVIAPIGEAGSQTRRDIDGLMKLVIRPVLSECECSAIISHQISDTGSITSQVIKHLLEDDLVVADLSGVPPNGPNPNVMYELAIRHARRKPAVMMAEEGTKLPFDLFAERTLFFRRDAEGLAELVPKLKRTISGALTETDSDNPIYRVVTDSIMQEVAKTQTDKHILARLESIHAGLSTVLKATEAADTIYSYEVRLRGENRILQFVNRLHNAEIFETTALSCVRRDKAEEDVWILEIVASGSIGVDTVKSAVPPGMEFVELKVGD